MAESMARPRNTPEIIPPTKLRERKVTREAVCTDCRIIGVCIHNNNWSGNQENGHLVPKSFGFAQWPHDSLQSRKAWE